MSRDSTKSSLAFFLSIVIHTLLAVAIIYTGLDMSLPEGTVNSTEVDYIGGPIPQGSQTEDATQVVDTVAVKEAPPPPPPPKPAPQLPPKPVDVADTKSESAVATDVAEKEPEPTPEVTEERNEETLPTTAETNTNNEAVTEDPSMHEQESVADAEPIEDNPVDGNSDTNESAYGTSSGVQSDASLSPVPGNKNPEYPMWARLRRQEGVVVVQFDVLDDGSVANSQVVQSSGFEALDAAAIKAHEKWRYRPGKTGRFSKNYNFRLTGQAEEAPSQLRRSN